MRSRVTTTRVLAEAIAASDTKPALPGRQRDRLSTATTAAELVTEDTDSRGDSLLTRVTRAWQAAAEPAAEAGARVVRPAHRPGLRPAQPAPRRAAAAVQGRPRRSARRRPPVRADDLHARLGRRGRAPRRDRDRRRAGQPVLRAGADQRASSPGSSAHQVHRPAFFRVPGVRSSARRRARWPNELLGSVELRPGRPAGQRLHLPRPRRQRRAARGPRPLALTLRPPASAPRDPPRARCARTTGRVLAQRHAVRSPGRRPRPRRPGRRPARTSRCGVAPQHPEAEHLRHDAGVRRARAPRRRGAAGRRRGQRVEPGT